MNTQDLLVTAAWAANRVRELTDENDELRARLGEANERVAEATKRADVAEAALAAGTLAAGSRLMGDVRIVPAASPADPNALP